MLRYPEALLLCAGLALPPPAGAAPVATPASRVVARTLEGDADLPYFLYVPSRAAEGAPLLVSVHGISRNAEEHARLLAPIAERYGVVLVAPLFSEQRFPDYQRLGIGRSGQRADLALERILAEVACLTGADTRRFYLFGYSGGGQFTHRYAMAHPERVAGYVVGAAGWYTFPDAERRYPLGIGARRNGPTPDFAPARFLAVPGTVMVGERDRHPGTALRKTQNVEALQGCSRLERGQRWVEAMNRAAMAEGLPAHFRFEVLPRSPHSFRRSMRRGELGERLFRQLFGERG